jgi:dolichol-phosphate mannosyltransferase
MENRALVIIPTYNEKENIRGIVELALQQSPVIDVLIVDDGSPDGTGDIVEAMGQTNPRIQLMRRAGKQGLGTAYIAGFKWGLARGYEWLIEMDADFSHDPKVLPTFLREIATADLVIGSRYTKGGVLVNWPFKRLLLSRGAAAYVRLITGIPVADQTGGFKCFHRRVLEAINLDDIRCSGYAFQIEMNYKTWMRGFRIREVPITFTDRAAGQSKMSGRIMREALTQVWMLAASQNFRRTPPRR